MENVDVSFPAAPPHNYIHPHHNRHQVLQKYTAALRQLRANAGQIYRVRPFYFDKYVLHNNFQQRSSSGSDDLNAAASSPPLAFFKMELLKHILDRRRQILYWLFYISLALLCVLVYRHESSAAVAERSVQSFVYPGMRMWRRLTLPIIERFPRLTELYDEACLMENPFFQVEDLSCEPCAHLQSVLDLTQSAVGLAQERDGDSRETPSEFVPFVFKIDQNAVTVDQFYNIYANNHETFQRDAFRVQSTNHDVTNLEELFSQFNQSHPSRRQNQEPPPPPLQAHNLWRCNRMLPGRLLRQLFARPERLPSTGIALERFLSIDTPKAQAYTLPDTECANVYVQQALGTRFIILRPTSECRHRCRTLSMRLPQSFVLSYNWWYWKPISAPDPVSDSISISLIGSYC